MEGTSASRFASLNGAGYSARLAGRWQCSRSDNRDTAKLSDNGDGTFSATLTAPLSPSIDTIKVTISAGNKDVLLAQKPVVKYYLCGDANGSNGLSILDATFVIAYLFKNGPDPVPTTAADANGNGAVNILDATYLISYLFKSGPAPACP